MLHEREQRDKLHLAREKEDKNLDRIWVFNWSCGMCRIWECKDGEKEILGKNIT